MTPPSAILDQYPSTSDFHTKEPVDDPVLLILKNARERYRAGAANYTYAEGSRVCAVGAIGVEVGAEEGWQDIIVDKYYDQVQFHGIRNASQMYAYYLEYELKISKATKEAISLLDKSALFLYGDKIPKNHSYTWALEYVNQQFVWVNGEAKEAVLNCYDHAILERERAVIA